jgi:hypothetical protein
MSWSRKVIFPEATGRRPMMDFRRVVFPAPFGPTMQVIPGFTSRETFRRACTGPRKVFTSWHSITGSEEEKEPFSEIIFSFVLFGLQPADR